MSAEFIKTYVFSKGCHSPLELKEWCLWFIHKGLFAFIRERHDGLFDLVVEGEELPTKGEEGMGCKTSPCLNCGATTHLKIVNGKLDYDPYPRFCCDACLRAYMTKKRLK